MYGASETIADDLVVNDTLTVTGASTLTGAVTASGTLTAQKLVGAAIATAGVTGVAIDLSNVLGSQSAIKFVATLDTPTALSGTTVNTGWMKVNVGGAARYIPFYT